MENEKKRSPLQKYLDSKPGLEDTINRTLVGDKKKNALNFVAWLQESKLVPKINRGTYNDWESHYKNKPICGIGLPRSGISDGIWTVRLRLIYMDSYSETILSEGLQGIILDTARSCDFSESDYKKNANCRTPKSCAPGKSVTILGKSFVNLCGLKVRFENPDEVIFNAIKQLLELEKQARDVYYLKNKQNK